MAIITPNWTNNVAVVTKQLLTRGQTVSGTIDLSNKFSAYVFLRVGRTSAFALSSGINLRGIRTVASQGYTGSTEAVTTPIAAAAITQVNSDSANNQKAVFVQSTAGFSAGDVICIRDAVLSRMEFCRIINKTNTALVTDRNLKYTHNASDADIVTNTANVVIWQLDGGCPWEIMFDYGDDTSGDSVVVEAWAQTYDSQTSV